MRYDVKIVPALLWVVLFSSTGLASRKEDALAAAAECRMRAAEVHSLMALPDLLPGEFSELEALAKTPETLLGQKKYPEALQAAEACIARCREVRAHAIEKAPAACAGMFARLARGWEQCRTRLKPEQFPADQAIRAAADAFGRDRIRPLLERIQQAGGTQPAPAQAEILRDLQAVAEICRRPPVPPAPAADEKMPAPAALAEVLLKEILPLLKALPGDLDTTCAAEDPCELPYMEALQAKEMRKEARRVIQAFCALRSKSCRDPEFRRNSDSEIADLLSQARRLLKTIRERMTACQPFADEERRLRDWGAGFQACGAPEAGLLEAELASVLGAGPKCHCDKAGVQEALRRHRDAVAACDSAGAEEQGLRLQTLLKDCDDAVGAAFAAEIQSAPQALQKCVEERVLRQAEDEIHGDSPEEALRILKALTPSFPGLARTRTDLLERAARLQKNFKLAEEWMKRWKAGERLALPFPSKSLTREDGADMIRRLCVLGQGAPAQRAAELLQKMGLAVELPMGCEPPPPPSAPAQAPAPPAPAVEAPVAPALQGDGGFLTLNIWQSAWDDWTDLSRLTTFLRKNGIREINLNPGLPLRPDLEEQTLRQLDQLVRAFRGAGILRIHYLYAELQYPIGAYARFLNKHRQALGIETLVDDSEFVDASQARFQDNRNTVQAEHLRYSAFVTVEQQSNSGVSDETRYWALDHVDSPILMSYFGCNLEEQKSWLDPYLSHADRRGRKDAVKIAILLGTKHVGRESSCEENLKPPALQDFLAALHAWASVHPSYGGIVLETNQRMPGCDVARPRRR